MFKKYQHVEKIGNQAVEGLLDGMVHVFTKLDGANASVWFEDGEVKVGSRNRELDTKENLRGFYQYVQAHEGIQKFVRDYPSFILYGEWLVPHSVKTYDETAWKEFYVFDMYDPSDDTYIHYEVYKNIMEKYGINYIPVIASILFPDKEDLMAVLDQCTFMNGDKAGEGIVCKRYSFRNKYGNVVWGKIVRNEFLESKGEPVVKDIATGIEEVIVNAVVTESLVQKEVAKITEGGALEGKQIPQVLGRVWYCLINEELFDQIKKHKMPVIDFHKLNKACNAKVKAVLGL